MGQQRPQGKILPFYVPSVFEELGKLHERNVLLPRLQEIQVNLAKPLAGVIAPYLLSETVRSIVTWISWPHELAYGSMQFWTHLAQSPLLQQTNITRLETTGPYRLFFDRDDGMGDREPEPMFAEAFAQLSVKSLTLHMDIPLHRTYDGSVGPIESDLRSWDEDEDHQYTGGPLKAWRNIYSSMSLKTLIYSATSLLPDQLFPQNTDIPYFKNLTSLYLDLPCDKQIEDIIKHLHGNQFLNIHLYTNPYIAFDVERFRLFINHLISHCDLSRLTSFVYVGRTTTSIEPITGPTKIQLVMRLLQSTPELKSLKLSDNNQDYYLTKWNDDYESAYLPMFICTTEILDDLIKYTPHLESLILDSHYRKTHGPGEERISLSHVVKFANRMKQLRELSIAVWDCETPRPGTAMYSLPPVKSPIRLFIDVQVPAQGNAWKNYPQESLEFYERRPAVRRAARNRVNAARGYIRSKFPNNIGPGLFHYYTAHFRTKVEKLNTPDKWLEEYTVNANRPFASRRITARDVVR